MLCRFWSPPLVFVWMGAGDNKISVCCKAAIAPQDSRIGKKANNTLPSEKRMSSPKHLSEGTGDLQKNAHNLWHKKSLIFWQSLLCSVRFILFYKPFLKGSFLIGCWRISTHLKVSRALLEHTEQSGPHNVREKGKLCLKMVSEVVCIFVWGNLGLWKDVEVLTSEQS